MHTLVASSSMPPPVPADALAALTLKGQNTSRRTSNFLPMISNLQLKILTFLTFLQFRIPNSLCNLRGAPEQLQKSVWRNSLRLEAAGAGARGCLSVQELMLERKQTEQLWGTFWVTVWEDCGLIMFLVEKKKSLSVMKI
jgi:hypothetical protein